MERKWYNMTIPSLHPDSSQGRPPRDGHVVVEILSVSWVASLFAEQFVFESKVSCGLRETCSSKRILLIVVSVRMEISTAYKLVS